MEHVTTELPDLLLNVLSEQDRLRVESHLAECPSCMEDWESISSLRSTLPARRSAVRPSNEAVPPGYFSTLPARILERRQTGSRSRAFEWIRPALQNYLAPLAAGVIVIIVLSQVRLEAPKDENAAGLPVSPGDAIEYVWENDAMVVLEPMSSQVSYLSDATFANQELNGVVTPGLEDLDPQSVQDLVADLSDAEVERLIVSLNERAIL